MSDWMNRDIARTITLYFPSIGREAVFLDYCGYGEWFIKTKNGDCYVFDQFEQGIFHVAENVDDLDETQYRRIFRYRLKKIMEWRKVSQSDMAELTGLNRKTIGRYINGETLPNVYTLYILAKVLKCSVEDLVYFNVKGEQDV